nr:MAG TPA: hypothetical protein [Caudoviricetes sp.]
MIISKVATKDVPITVRSFLPFFACAPFPLTIFSGLCANVGCPYRYL